MSRRISGSSLTVHAPTLTPAARAASITLASISVCLRPTSVAPKRSAHVTVSAGRARASRTCIVDTSSVVRSRGTSSRARSTTAGLNDMTLARSSTPACESAAITRSSMPL